VSAAPATVQRKVVLTGKKALTDRVLKIINKGLSPTHIASLSGKGEIEIKATGSKGKLSTQNTFFKAKLKALINEAGTTTVGVSAGSGTIVGSYHASDIDIADIEALGIGSKGWDARGALIHELIEQRQKQLAKTKKAKAYGSATTGAHGKGLAAELGFIGAKLESDSGLVGGTKNKDGTINGHRTVVFKYPDGTRWKVKVTLDHNNITKVKRTKLK
jgi:hypothetical protein